MENYRISQGRWLIEESVAVIRFLPVNGEWVFGKKFQNLKM